MTIFSLRGATAAAALSAVLLLGTAFSCPAQTAEVRDSVPHLIRPGDVVFIKIWREPELSGHFLVDNRGIVTLPMLGPLQAAGETQESLRERVVREFSVSLVDPTVEFYIMKRVRIMGEVREPGLYNLDPTMTIGDALAEAGGASELGERKEVILMRDGREVAADLAVDLAVADSPIRSGDELIVPERSWFERNTGAVVTGLSATLGVLVALIAR